MSPAFSLHDVMTRLGVSRKTVLLLIARGKLRGFKVGRQWRFDPADVTAFVEAQKAEVTPRVVQTPAPAFRATASSVRWKGSERYLQ